MFLRVCTAPHLSNPSSHLIQSCTGGHIHLTQTVQLNTFVYVYCVHASEHTSSACSYLHKLCIYVYTVRDIITYTVPLR